MYTYKFRLLFDEVEDFVRDYEILAEQTFKDFHDIIQQSILGLDSHELASFYICDRRWEKTEEITLIDMEEEENQDNYNTFLPKSIMKEAVLSSFIDDPHQRLIYEYDFLNLKVFYIELLKTFESDPKKQYPLCTFSSGELPKPIILSDLEAVLEEQAEILEEEDMEDYYDEEDFESLNNDIEI